MSVLLLTSALALAAPKVVVVGLHVPERSAEDAASDAERFAEALEASGKVDALTPEESARVLSGREALVLEAYALGAGREKLQEGRVLYDRAQPDAAIPVLEDAARMLAAGLDVRSDARDLREALLLLAMAHYGLGDEGAAREAFRRAATLAPDLQLDAVNYPPDAIALFDAERQRLVAAAPAVVTLSSTRPGQLYVDGRAMGTAPAELRLVPGQHHVAVRGDGGAAWFDAFVVKSGQTRTVSATLAEPSLGAGGTEAAARSRQVRDLYRGLGKYTDGVVVALAGVTANGQVAVQLYDPASGNFSRAQSSEAGGDPVGALVDLAPVVAGFVEAGGLRADRVSPQVVSLDVGTNDVLAGMLLDPKAPASEAPAPTDGVAEQRRGVPWFVWAGVGALAAGGGAAAAVVATSGTDGAPSGVSGTVVFGPIP